MLFLTSLNMINITAKSCINSQNPEFLQRIKITCADLIYIFLLAKKNMHLFKLLALTLLLSSVLSTTYPFLRIDAMLCSGYNKVNLKLNDILKTTVEWEYSGIPLEIQYVVAGTSSTKRGLSPLVLQRTAAGNQLVTISISQIATYIAGTFSLIIQVNGAVVATQSSVFLQNTMNIYSFKVESQVCSFTVLPIKTDSSANIKLYGPLKGRRFDIAPDYQISQFPKKINIGYGDAGTWHIQYYPGTACADTPFVIQLTTQCSQFCSSSFNYYFQKICIPTCGDGVQAEKQICDNGNKTGCLNNCQPDQNYKCTGIVGSTSYCSKEPFCGDKVLDTGEICDNGNLIGCSTNCKVDQGYQCTSVTGKISLCSQCGNGILEYGQQCDNRNQIGCSFGCKIDAGFECRSNICSRKNPVCGNGIIQIAEGCDDGNSLSLDGCSNSCRVELGYICKGQFGLISDCKKQSAVCGNGVFQLPSPGQSFQQQCDNGNQEGCRGCVIEKNWKCSSIAGQRSSCFIDISAPSCGNGVYENWKGQQCDDGNISNGDGCNNRCTIEFGWNCPNGIQCSRNNTPPPEQKKSFCGNGIIEPPWQDCDNGFPLQNKNGCTTNCKFLK